MEQSQSKQRSIIAAYYTAHHEELRAFVAVRLASPDVAEDIVQNVFLKLLQSDRMIAAVTLPCLVYTMARNLVFDHWRHRKKVEEYEHVITKTDWQPRLAGDAGSVYSAQETREILERGIARLGDKRGMVYRLSVYEGMPVREISTCLGMRYKSVENHLGTARRQVREYVKASLLA